jgi:beta-galactosidase
MTLAPLPPRQRLCLDRDWLFSFGHPQDPRRDHFHRVGYFSYLAKAGYGDGPAAADFDDRSWQKLDLPHDWAVELPYAQHAGHSHGYKALGRDFPEHDVGWYRRRFAVAESEIGRRFWLEFAGVFRAGEVFVNGFYLGCEPSGHTSFHYDITDYLNYGGENVIAVRVDASLEEGWYYEGAGIYRHVWLTKTGPLHVAHDGIFVTSEVGEGHAVLTVRAEIENHAARKVDGSVVHRVLDDTGSCVAQCRENGLGVEPGSALELVSNVLVTEPRLWSVASPTLYRLATTLLVERIPVDEVETSFGIRSIVFDADHGFFLNGEHVVLKGTNNHQDHAGIGTALPDAMQAYRIRCLKQLGSNAYRSSHHPPTPELLDACDRLGMLVIDENRSMGSSPKQLGELERMIRRDRNHPSVILWSLGNEEWAVEGNVKGERIAATMQQKTQRLDPTRRVTAAISGGWGRGISTVIDVMGYNYVSHGSTDEQHARFPHQPGVGTEESTTLCTRGIYATAPEVGHAAPVIDEASGGSGEVGWKHYAARPYLAGLFYWTGFDYRGEPNPFAFPAVSSQFGILDSCGMKKDWAYYLMAWWGTEPVLHVMPHWNWPGREGEPIQVCVFTNAREVELLHNGNSLGTKSVEPNGHLEWQVVYAPGKLEARGRTEARWNLSHVVETTGAPTRLCLEVDRPRILADGVDVAVVTVSAVDDQARAVPTADSLVSFSCQGAGRILGVGNGDPSSHEPDCYRDVVEVLELAGTRMRAIDGAVDPAELGLGFDDRGWVELLDAVPGANQAAPHRIIRGLFDLPRPLGVPSARLLLRWFGESQDIYLNGERIGSFSRQETTRLPEIELRSEALKVGKNLLAMVATPYRDVSTRERDERVRPALLRIDRPAPAWRRKLFSGLAQVIVQSDGTVGEIGLTATSPGLVDAQVTMAATAAPEAQGN